MHSNDMGRMKGPSTNSTDERHELACVLQMDSWYSHGGYRPLSRTSLCIRQGTVQIALVLMHRAGWLTRAHAQRVA